MKNSVGGSLFKNCMRMFDELLARGGGVGGGVWQDHQTTNLVQVASKAWHEACPVFATPCLWEQVCLDEKFGWRVPHNTQVTPRQRSVPSHHR